MRRLVITLLLLGLVPPAGAAAKEVTSATLCGAGGCRTTHDRDGGTALSDGNALAGPPDHATPYYTVRLDVTHEGADVMSWTTRWAPAPGLVRTDGENGDARWFRPTPQAAALLRRLSDGLRPFPAGGLKPLTGPTPARPGGQLKPEIVSFGGSEGPGAERRGGGDTAIWALGGGAAAVIAGAGALVLALRRRATPRPPVVTTGQ